MTREEFRLKIATEVHWLEQTDYENGMKLFNQIFDEHEAQLKAKENDLERQDMIIKCLSMDLDSKEWSNVNEKIIKAKDKEIDRLKKECEYDQRNAAMSQEESVFLLDELKKERKKARSIVAMLFWKMKRQKKVFQKYYEAYGHNNSLTNCYRGMFEQALMDFNKSRKMLKDSE